MGETVQMADVVIVGDDSAQQGIRFNLFQLFFQPFMVKMSV